MPTTLTTTTPATSSPTTDRAARELRLVREDLAAGRPSYAADRKARLDAEDAERKAAAEARRAARRQAVIEARERYWAARGRAPRSRR